MKNTFLSPAVLFLPFFLFSSFKSLIGLMLKHFRSLNFSWISCISLFLCTTFWKNSMTCSSCLLIYSSVISILRSQPIFKILYFSLFTSLISTIYNADFFLYFKISHLFLSRYLSIYDIFLHLMWILKFVVYYSSFNVLASSNVWLFVIILIFLIE